MTFVEHGTVMKLHHVLNPRCGFVLCQVEYINVQFFLLLLTRNAVFQYQYGAILLGKDGGGWGEGGEGLKPSQTLSVNRK